MPPFSEKTLQPSDFCFSRHPHITGIMRTMRDDIGSDNVNQARFMTCGDVDRLLPSYPTVRDRVRLLQKIAAENNDFISNWRTAQLPRIFLAGTFLRVLHDSSITEDDHVAISSLVETGLSQDHFCIDDGVAASLCGRKFPLEMRELMLNKFIGISKANIRFPNRDIVTSKVFRAFFARTKGEDAQETIAIGPDQVQNAMDWALSEFKNRPNVLDDGMIVSYIYNSQIPYSKILHLMDFVCRQSHLRKYKGRDYRIGGLSVYNAWYTRALQEKEINMPDPSKILQIVLEMADAQDMDRFVYLEGLIAGRNRDA